MRLFTAIDVPGEILRKLGSLIAHLKPSARIHWSPVTNLHITTKFVGEWPESRLGELTAALKGLPQRTPFQIAIRGLGFFPNPRAPRVFWAGIEAPPVLSALALDTSNALEKLGVAPEQRAFSPHLTIARIKEPLPLERLHQAIAALPSKDFGTFTADRFHLYQSRLTPSGSIYTKLSEYPFHIS